MMEHTLHEPGSKPTAAPTDAGSGGALRVIWVVAGGSEGPSMYFVRKQIESLAALGVEGRGFFLDSSRVSLGSLVAQWRRLRREIREFDPDLIHAQFGTATGFLCACCTRRPLVVTYRGSDLNRNRKKGWLRCFSGRLLSQLTAIRARRIICVSRRLAGRLWWCRKLVSVIPSAVDTGLFRPRPRDVARRELGWPEEGYVVLFNAVNPRVKRLDLAKAAVEAARCTLTDVRLVCLDGSQSRETVATMMNASDCVLMTSDFEGSPNIVKEAVASGLPVVSRDVGDVGERLAGVAPSRIVGSDPGEIGAAIVEIVANGGRANVPEAIERLSPAKIAAQVRSVYRAALGDTTERSLDR
jgi:glycosyltransferase involved in cell wall biosynthesis